MLLRVTWGTETLRVVPRIAVQPLYLAAKASLYSELGHSAIKQHEGSLHGNASARS